MILKIIFFVYIYMMLLASAGVLNCETNRRGECGDQWTQAFTVSGGAITTLWAFITDNPIQSGARSQSPSSRTSGKVQERAKKEQPVDIDDRTLS